MNMMVPTPQPLRMGPQGRVVIPAAMRQQMGIAPGDELVAVIEDGRLVLENRANLLARVQARFKQAAGQRMLSNELIEERRAEAAREALAPKARSKRK